MEFICTNEYRKEHVDGFIRNAGHSLRHVFLGGTAEGGVGRGKMEERGHLGPDGPLEYLC